MKFLLLIFVAMLSISSCDREVGPPVVISEAIVFAPLPGTGAFVAYMTIKNNTHDDIEIGSISSPQFDSVMLHETEIVDGIARMKMLQTLRLPARSSLVLAAGGKHIMLDRPVTAVELGQSVALHIGYDADGLVIVSTTVQSRIDFESAN